MDVVADLKQAMGAVTLDGNYDDEGERLVIGLDFGTTYSGVSYVFTSKPDQVYIINEWPGNRVNAVKVPTLIKYDTKDSFKWGYELDRSTADRIEGIKLLLDPDQPKPLYVPAVDTEAALKKLGKPAIDVATDYIHAIYQHALRKIASKYPKSYLDLLNKQYVLSVPAVWSDKAKEVTLRAARNAGITPIKLIKEPEAAALFTLHSMGNRGLEVGDALVLCDAGGGTVDLTSYEIVELSPLKLKELVTPSGGMAGSLMLNRRFEEWVKNVVGERQYINLKETDAYRSAMKTFDTDIKPGFRSKADKDVYISFAGAKLKDDPAKGLERDSIKISGKTLHAIFEPVLRDVDSLVSAQVKDVYLKRMKDKHPKGFEIKAIFLVGGFGSNAYLCDAVTKAHPEVQVIQPNDAWAAIVRGAVMSQLPTEASVKSNVAPKHYGTSAGALYDEDRDYGEDKYWDPHEGVWRCKTMTWYIAKGDDLERSRKIEFPFYRSFSPNPSSAELQTVEILRECGADKAPTHPKDGVVVKNCSLQIDLSDVPKTSFKKNSRINDSGERVEWWELHYKLMVSVEASLNFSMEVAGKEYGKVSANY